MTSDGFKCYEYNEANQLAKAKECGSSLNIAEYTYDYNGNRMVKKNYLAGTHKNTVTSWSDSFETKQIVGGATENTSYYFVNGELLSKKDKDGNRFYLHNDHLGSIGVMTNAAGSVVENTEYDPWGELKSGGTKSKFLYTGQEHDDETGLEYYNFRYYNSDIRRFTQPDDIIQDVYKPQMLNRYSYVTNNPIRYTDPTGHFIDTVLDVAFIAYDVSQIAQHGATTENVAALAADVASAFIPGVTGGGLAVHAIAQGGHAVAGVAAVAKVADKAETVTQIKVTENRLKHVYDSHIEGGKSAKGTSLFYNKEDVPGLIKSAEKVQPVKQNQGKNYERVLDVGKNIGTDRHTSKPTSIMTVITNKVGKMITAFPGIHNPKPQPKVIKKR